VVGRIGDSCTVAWGCVVVWWLGVLAALVVAALVVVPVWVGGLCLAGSEGIWVCGWKGLSLSLCGKCGVGDGFWLGKWMVFVVERSGCALRGKGV
jgi:hypothetical protein